MDQLVQGDAATEGGEETMTVPLRVCWIIAIALNGIELAWVIYARIDDYLHPVGDVFVPLSALALFLSVPAMSLVVLLWLAKRFSKPHDLERA